MRWDLTKVVAFCESLNRNNQTMDEMHNIIKRIKPGLGHDFSPSRRHAE